MSVVDPWKSVSTSQVAVTKDKQLYQFKASDCITHSDLAAKKGGAVAFHWVPPRDVRRAVGGQLYSDSRGQYQRLHYVKVRITNKIAQPLYVKYSVPVGNIEDPTLVTARPYVGDATLAPTGGKKNASRGKGKKKKEFSRATDSFVLYFTAGQLMRGDVNQYAMAETIVPASVTSSVSRAAFHLVDMVWVMPDINLNAGGKFDPNLEIVEVSLSVKYEVSRVGSPPDSTIEDVKQFGYGKLSNIQDMYYIDAENSIATNRPLLRMTPAADGYLRVQRETVSGTTTLILKRINGSVVEDFRWEAAEDDSTVMVLPALSGLEITHADGESGKAESAAAYNQFGFRDNKWVLINQDGTVGAIATESNFNWTDKVNAPARTPALLYAVPVKYSTKTVGGVKKRVCEFSLQQPRAILFTWVAFTTGLSVVIKILEIARGFGEFMAGRGR